MPLKKIVKKIYRVLKNTEIRINKLFPELELSLAKDIKFITTKRLEQLYPNLSRKEREYEITKKFGSVFLIGIGNKLKDGVSHDSRASDYDDWNLNGDLLVYYSTLDIALELSSMGIRVDEESLMRQLELAGCPERAELDFQKALLNHELPYTIGGGLGQSRICMYCLRKAHIGEVQSSTWPEHIIKHAGDNGIQLL